MQKKSIVWWPSHSTAFSSFRTNMRREGLANQIKAYPLRHIAIACTCPAAGESSAFDYGFKCYVIVDPNRYRQWARPSLRVFILKKLNTVLPSVRVWLARSRLGLHIRSVCLFKIKMVVMWPVVSMATGYVTNRFYGNSLYPKLLSSTSHEFWQNQT